MTYFADMIEGYRRFRNGGWAEQRERWEQLAEGQSPKGMIIACSDSRSEPSQIFDVCSSDLFVVRNVAALVPPFETTPGRHGVSAALEFAVQFLKIEEIVVMGHGMCGGCHAALHRSMVGAEPGRGGFIADWIAVLDEAAETVRAAHPDIDNREARSEEHTSELQSLMRISYAVFCLQKKKTHSDRTETDTKIQQLHAQ